MYIHIFILPRTLPWNHDGILHSTRQSVPLLLDVLLQQLLHSRNSRLCPEIMSTSNIPRQARPVEHTAALLSSRTAPKIYEYCSNPWTTCPPRAVTNLVVMVFIVWCISPSMRSSHNSIVYSGKQGINIFPDTSRDSKYCTTIQVLILSQLLF